MSITPLSAPPFIPQLPGNSSKKPSDTNPPSPPHDQAPRTFAGNEKVNAAPDTGPSAEVQTKIDKISTLLERNNVIQMMSTPNARETRQNLKEIRELLSEDSLKTLTSNPRELAKLKHDIGQGLNEKNMRSLQREAAVGPNPEQFHHHLSNTDQDVPWRGAQQMQAEQRKEDHRINQRARLSDPLCKHLVSIGEPYRPPEPETTPATAAVEPDKGTAADNKKPESTLASGPKSAPQIQTADNAQKPGELHPTLKKIDELISRESLVNILRDPDSAQSLQRVEELKGLLNEESLNAWTRDSSLQEKLKARVRQVISGENLDTLRREAGIAAPGTSAGAGDAKGSDAASERIKRIGELIAPDAILRRLREPGSAENIQQNRELEELLSEDSLKALADKPNELAELKKQIEQLASANYIQALHNDLSHAVA
ncbi:hypothetical protein [Pseudomonas fluorescens]|uniref:hypothetical protein n=1 Tax=Pseudomonas fluorescens TaxID=294 RepID=UPI0020CA7D4A|nr:hypothetical protein [Pseudomonas fluorescens]